MKFLEGKTPAERNKIIAAMVLGLLAFVTLAYTFVFSAGSSNAKTTANANANSNRGAASINSNANRTGVNQTIEQARAGNPFDALGALPDNPFAPAFGDAPSRNIFALYEPSNNPPPAPKPVEPSPVPLPSPVPTPPLLASFVSPQNIYARQGDFSLDLSGDKFPSDAKILFNGQEMPTQFVSGQQLRAKIPVAAINDAGQRQVMVRNTDGSQTSNVLFFEVQAPPVPQFAYVGLVARKRFNNDTAMLQDKQSKQYQNVRLGEVVGRFKVVSISTKEVVMQDTQLNFRHSLAFVDEKSAGGRTGGTGRTDNPSGFPPGINPNVQVQTYPGIPPQYTQQPPPPPPPSNDDEDDDN